MTMNKTSRYSDEVTANAPIVSACIAGDARHFEHVNRFLLTYYLLTSSDNDEMWLAGDGALRLMPFQQGDRNQQWERDMQQGYIRSRQDHNRVLDIFSQSLASHS